MLGSTGEVAKEWEGLYIVGVNAACVGTCPCRLRCLGGGLMRENKANMQSTLGAS